MHRGASSVGHLLRTRPGQSTIRRFAELRAVAATLRRGAYSIARPDQAGNQRQHLPPRPSRRARGGDRAPPTVLGVAEPDLAHALPDGGSYGSDGQMTLSARDAGRPPRPLTNLDGRAGELAEIARLLEQSRLLTLKSRLSQQERLLVLDNFEQLVVAAPMLTELLAGCLALKILVTSRDRLRVYGEQTLLVRPLILPDAGRADALQHVCEASAVRLFVERARALKPALTVTADNARAVAGICRALDGLPLAIEVAAARVALLPPAAMLARLDHRLTLLTRGARDLPLRQQSLQGAIAWSFDLLAPAEQALLRRLGIFVGGCTLEATTAVCAGNGDLDLDLLHGLESLLDKSLVRQEETNQGEPRFLMLETIREFALTQLHASDEADELRELHAAYYLSLLERAASVYHSPGDVFVLDLLKSEGENMRSALRYLIERDDGERAMRFAHASWWYCPSRGLARDARRQLADILACASASGPSVWRMRTLALAGRFAYFESDHTAARPLLEESLATARERGHARGIARALDFLGLMVRDRGDYEEARSLLEESLALWQREGDASETSILMERLGMTLFHLGEQDGACDLISRALTMSRELGDVIMVGYCQLSLGQIVHVGNDLGRASEYYVACRSTWDGVGYEPGIAEVAGYMGDLALDMGDLASAREHHFVSLQRSWAAGDKRGSAHGWEGMAKLAAVEGDTERALRLAGAAAALRLACRAALPPSWRARLEYSLDPARQTLGAAAAAAAWTEGDVMSPDEAMAYALGAAASLAPRRSAGGR